MSEGLFVVPTEVSVCPLEPPPHSLTSQIPDSSRDWFRLGPVFTQRNLHPTPRGFEQVLIGRTARVRQFWFLPVEHCRYQNFIRRTVRPRSRIVVVGQFEPSRTMHFVLPLTGVTFRMRPWPNFSWDVFIHMYVVPKASLLLKGGFRVGYRLAPQLDSFSVDTFAQNSVNFGRLDATTSAVDYSRLIPRQNQSAGS